MLRLSAAPPVMIAAGRAASGPYRHITDSQWARALEVYTALDGGEIDQIVAEIFVLDEAEEYELSVPFWKGSESC